MRYLVLVALLMLTTVQVVVALSQPEMDALRDLYQLNPQRLGSLNPPWSNDTSKACGTDNFSSWYGLTCSDDLAHVIYMYADVFPPLLTCHIEMKNSFLTIVSLQEIWATKGWLAESLKVSATSHTSSDCTDHSNQVSNQRISHKHRDTHARNMTVAPRLNLGGSSGITARTHRTSTLTQNNHLILELISDLSSNDLIGAVPESISNLNLVSLCVRLT